jgi:hypothetical protein
VVSEVEGVQTIQFSGKTVVRRDHSLLINGL